MFASYSFNVCDCLSVRCLRAWWGRWRLGGRLVWYWRWLRMGTSLDVQCSSPASLGRARLPLLWVQLVLCINLEIGIIWNSIVIICTWSRAGNNDNIIWMSWWILAQCVFSFPIFWILWILSFHKIVFKTMTNWPKAVPMVLKFGQTLEVYLMVRNMLACF